MGKKKQQQPRPKTAPPAGASEPTDELDELEPDEPEPDEPEPEQDKAEPPQEDPAIVQRRLYGR